MPSPSNKTPQPEPSSSRVVWIVGGAVAVAAAVGIWMWRGKSPSSKQPTTSASGETSESAERPSSGTQPGGPSQRRTLTPEQQRQQEEALREMLRRGQQAAQGQEGPASEGGGLAMLDDDGKPLEPLPKPGVLEDGGSPFNDYIQKRMQKDMIPRAAECFDSAKVDNPGLSGRVVLSFRIVPSGPRGSVVQGARVVDDTSTLKDPFLSRCLAESAAFVRFGAPPEGYGETTLQYPLDFPLPEPPDGGGGRN